MDTYREHLLSLVWAWVAENRPTWLVDEKSLALPEDYQDEFPDEEEDHCALVHIINPFEFDIWEDHEMLEIDLDFEVVAVA